MKCFTKLTYTMAAFVDDLDFGFKIAQRATEYGVDGFSMPQAMAFGFELKEAGILSDADFAGCPSDNEGKFYWLLDRIVRREGIGDVLANGTYWAAKQIGKGAEAYAHNLIKKHEQLPLKLGMLNPIYFLMYSTGEKMNITQIEGNFPQAPFSTMELKQEFVKDWVQAPNDKFKKYVLDWEFRGERSMPFYPPVEACCEIVDWQEKMHHIDDALGLCAGLSSFPLKPPYHIHNLPLFISHATGMDMDEAGLTQVFNRNRTLVRAINVRRGLRRADEKPPDDHWKKRFPELEAQLLDAYYKFKGWNHEGIPTKESLQALGLEYVAEDFLKRGILTDNGGAPTKETSAETKKK
jgi:benzoyl-CoA reductase subunit BamB